MWSARGWARADFESPNVTEAQRSHADKEIAKLRSRRWDWVGASTAPFAGTVDRLAPGLLCPGNGDTRHRTVGNRPGDSTARSTPSDGSTRTGPTSREALGSTLPDRK